MYTPFSEVIFDLHTLCNRYYVVCLKLCFAYRGEYIAAHNLFYNFHGVGMTQSDELVIINSLYDIRNRFMHSNHHKVENHANVQPQFVNSQQLTNSGLFLIPVHLCIEHVCLTKSKNAYFKHGKFE